MNLAKIKNIAVKATGNVYFLYTILFAAIFAVGYSPFWQNDRTFIWRNDGVWTWYPDVHSTGRFFREIIRNAMQGDFNIALFDFRLGFGADVLSNIFIINTGVVHLLTTFVPARYTEQFMNFFTVGMLYLSGVTFIHFALYMKQKGYAAIIGALAYTFNGWVFFWLPRHTNMFTYPLLYLPLMIEGLERTITGKKPYLLIISTFLMALSGFYFLYMILMFFMPYAIIRIHQLYPQNYIKNLFGRAGISAVYTIWGIVMAAITFLPAVLFMLDGSRGQFNLRSEHFIPSTNIDHYINFFMNLAGGLATSILLFPAIVIIAILWLIFDGNKDTKKDRIHWLVLVVLLAIMRLVPFGNLVMNGFVYSSNRWSFILAFIFSFVITMSLPYIYRLKDRMFNVSIFVILAFYAYNAIFVERFRNVYFFAPIVMLAVILAILTFVPAPQIQIWKKSVKFEYKKLLLVAVICANLAINAYLWFQDGLGHYANQFMRSGTTTELHVPMPDYLLNQDRFFRIDVQGAQGNTPLVRDFFGMTSNLSITNPNVLEFLNYLESFYTQLSFFINTWGAQSTINAITSVDYFATTLSPNSRWVRIPYGFENPEHLDHFNVFKNQHFLPFGFTYQNVVSFEDFTMLNPVQMQETMLQAIVLHERNTTGTTNITVNNIPFEIAEYENVTWQNGILNVASNNSSITLTFDDVTYSEVYVRFTNFTPRNRLGGTNVLFESSLGNIRRGVVFENSQFHYANQNNNHTTNLGFSEGVTNSVTITFENAGNFTLDNIEILALPMHNFAAQTAALREHTLTNLNLHERGLPGLTNRITGEITLPDSRYLFLSIPYSAGWRAYVNGQPAELLQANIAFMALELDAGHHEIELRYRTPGIRVGFILSLLGIAVFVLLIKFYPKISAKLKLTELENVE
ncbi:MAG: YfhO family protein [Defluviitaleaceae bacterium]|nr:YfhO family protein [Defluviitaleaceae bacterium]